MPSPKKVISREEWERKLADVKINKDELNKLIMNYLVIEGYKNAAERFSAESGIVPMVDLASIQQRMEMRNAIQQGRIEEAIERVNDLNPEILDTQPQLYFHLQQQRLIEFIREGKVQEALDFAQEELAPRGEENPEFLRELEKTMALLAFEDNRSSPVGGLLEYRQRQKTASELNSAILVAQSQEKEPRLPALIKLLAWAQDQLDERAFYPRMTDLTTGGMSYPDTAAMQT